MRTENLEDSGRRTVVRATKAIYANERASYPETSPVSVARSGTRYRCSLEQFVAGRSNEVSGRLFYRRDCRSDVTIVSRKESPVFLIISRMRAANFNENKSPKVV